MRIQNSSRVLLAASCAALCIHCGAVDPNPESKDASMRQQGVLTGVGEQLILPSTSTADGQFGVLVALSGSGGTALIGEPGGTGSTLSIRKAPSWSAVFSVKSSPYWSGSTRSLSGAISANGKIMAYGSSGASISLLEEVPAGTGTSWTPRGSISDGGLCTSGGSKFLGYSLALSADGSILVASCPDLKTLSSSGPLVFFRRQVASDGKVTYPLVGHLDSPSVTDVFGEHIALAGNGRTLLVSSRTQDSMSGYFRGHVHVFDLNSVLGVDRRRILDPADAEDGDGFGQAIAISDDGLTALIGAPLHGRTTPGSPWGAAYVFQREFTSFDLEQNSKLLAADRAANQFGAAVSLSRDGLRAMIGAPLDGGASEYGAAYLVALEGANWVHQTKLVATSKSSKSHYGSAVALDGHGNATLVGAPDRYRSVIRGDGAAYWYSLRRSVGDICSLNEECATGFCVDGVCCDQSCGGSNDADCQACSTAKGATANGKCQFLPSARVCRGSLGRCDPAESCTGTSASCPSDKREPRTTECRSAAGLCDQAEFCDGGVDCPSDLKKGPGEVCRAIAGACDKAEFCDGVSNDCPHDDFLDKTTVCSAAVGECDDAEYCDGKTAACPSDGFKSAGTLCGNGKGRDRICDDDDTCDGHGTCIVREARDMTMCEVSAGVIGKCIMGICETL